MTDAELTRAVAERLGWWNIGTYEITSRGVTYRGNPPMMDGDARQRLPDFATDLNAAWSLAPQIAATPLLYAGREYRVRMTPEEDGTLSVWWEVWIYDDAEVVPGRVLRGRPARTLCLAFLAATEGR